MPAVLDWFRRAMTDKPVPNLADILGSALRFIPRDDRDEFIEEATEALTAAGLIAVTARKPQPLPSVETLRQWMTDKTPVYLTFEGGDGHISDGYLPANRSIGRAIIGRVTDNNIMVFLDGGRIQTFAFEERVPSRFSPWLVSIGPRRDTVPAPLERPWLDATDPIVETWVGREIECTSAHTEPWTCVLMAIEGTVLRTDYSDHGDVVCARVHRKHLQVRLVSEVAK